ncbi:Serpentine receptor class gamma [Caenorhabditis elegans]|uniref:Serpentine receptor class gamma n=1 Tax=Caenorhabditis elegans TaxID=6239 RepID=G3MU03_CAEEL|nr:Serpentine receptor class gamma [Caenorhabditis elegans]CCD31095.2 Serpentine receptor class gamma [Caenorhabditis elegans]
MNRNVLESKKIKCIIGFLSFNLSSNLTNLAQNKQVNFQNILTYLNSFISIRLPQNTGINGNLSNFFLTHNEFNMNMGCPINLFHALHYYFAYTQYIYNFLISYNRFCAITSLLDIEKRWKRSLWIFVTIMFVYPMIPAGLIFFNRSYYTYVSSKDNFYISSTLGHKAIYGFLAPNLFIITIFNTVLNIKAYKKLLVLKKTLRSVPDTNLFYMSLAMFGIDSFLAVLSTFKAIIFLLELKNSSEFFERLVDWIDLLVPFASDALTLTQPLLLLYFSSTLRQKCIERLPFLKVFLNNRFFVRSRNMHQELTKY